MLVPACTLIPARFEIWRALTFASLILVVFADLLIAGGISVNLSPADAAVGTDLAAYYRPSGAARFLQSRGREGTFRYFGYAPRYEKGASPSAPYRFAEPLARDLEVNNRAMMLGLQNIQGYDPIHIARYDEFARAINDGREQDYHHVDFFNKAFDSPLLNLLNARYVIVSADTSSGNQPDLQRVLQDRSDDASSDRASVTKYAANRIELHTSTGAPGLLVLSEVYYPAWKAYVDGQPVPVEVADQLLRSVPVPAGEHTVELRYESWTLRVGIVISLAAYAALIALAVAAGIRGWRRRQGLPADKERQANR